MRKRFAFLGFIALMFALFPSVAFALDIWPNGSYWAGVPYDEPGYYAAFVRADNRYDAAVYGLGLDPASLSAATKLKLSDPSYGGNFYKYAMTFENVSGWDDMPEWLPAYVMMGTIGLGQSFERIYASKTTSALRTSALADYETVVSGGDLGGGGSGTPPDGSSVVFSGDYYSVNMFAWANDNKSGFPYAITAKNATFEDGVLTVGSGTKSCNSFIRSPDYVKDAVVFFSPEVASFVNQQISSGYDVFFRTGAIIVGTDFELHYGKAPGQAVNMWYYSTPHGYTTFDLTRYDDSYYYDGRMFFLVLSVATSGTFSSNTTFGSTYYSNIIDTPFDVSVPPSGDWPGPTTPATPDPPELPTPTAPTETADPDPTAPTITWPTAPTLVLPTSPIVSTTPDGIDYTALLTLINDNLNSIDAYLQNFYTSFNSFRSDFLSGVDDIVDGLRNIYQYLGHLNNILEVHCKHITDQIEESVYNLELYLKRLFEWLPQQLSFDADFNYDDSGIVDWLKLIYFKLGGGTYAPNPVADPGGFFEWLGGLVSGFLASLLAGLPGKVQELVSDVTDLTDYFPFSAPWDLYALLLLFAHDPVTPVFNIPWGMGGGHTVNVVVDCTQWDGVMAIVRSVQKIIFAGGLAKLTFDMFRPTDVMGD